MFLLDRNHAFPETEDIVFKTPPMLICSSVAIVYRGFPIGKALIDAETDERQHIFEKKVITEPKQAGF